MTLRRPLVIALALFSVAALAGCAPSPTPSGSTSASASASSSTTPSPTSTSKVDPNAPTGQCADKNLAVTITGADGAAGSTYSNVVFTNTGSTACNLQGAPGVSVVGKGNGTQLGVPASHEGSGTPAIVSVPAGGSVSAQLQSTNIGTDGGPLGSQCQATTGDGYRVYPPHSYHAFFVAQAGVAACASTVVWMHVQPVA